MPGLYWVGNGYFALMPRVATWVGVHWLHISVPPIVNHASGDQVADWIQFGLCLTVCFLAGAFWAGFHRAAGNDPRLAETSRIVLRYFLGFFLLRYGMSKVLHLQMPRPDSSRLLETYGESSPMGLLWTFIGQSASYSAYTGGLEVIAGLLLFFRRTNQLGALLGSAIMFNVVILNLCYDVPVKLFSATLFVFSTALAAPTIRRLWQLLVLHRTTAPVGFSFPVAGPPSRWVLRVYAAAKFAMIAWIIWIGPVSMTRGWIRGRPASSSLDGIYRVTDFMAGGERVPPLATDSRRWNWVGIDDGRTLFVATMNGSKQVYILQRKPGDKLVLRAPWRPGASRKPITTLSYTLAGGMLTLSGNYPDCGPVIVHLRRDDDARALMTRGFHWISQFPFGR